MTTGKASNPRGSSKWQTLSRLVRERARALDLPCSYCGQPFDWSLPSNHRMGCTADHSQALVLGGDLLPEIDQIGVMHRACNSALGRKQQMAAQASTKRKYASAPHNMQPEVPPDSLTPTSPTPARGGKTSPGYPSGYLAPASYADPRIVTPPSPDVAGTLADEWIPWLETQGVHLRPWQGFVLKRALEVDADGQLIFDTVVLSTPRQSGKSTLLRALAMGRCHFAEHFGEPQEVLHSSNNLQAARRIQTQALRWAAESGLLIRRAAGQEEIAWPDGSRWFLTSTKAVWGASGSVALVDETWDLDEEDVTSAIQPTLVERHQSQLWLASTANAETTPLMPKWRRRAMSGEDPRLLIVEWSAPPGADVEDPEVWKAASPFWHPAREKMVRSAYGSKGWAEQWLNRWPSDDEVNPGWPDGLASCPANDAVPGEFPVGAIEVSQDRSRYGAALAERDGNAVRLWVFSGDTLESAVVWLEKHEPAMVLAGSSIGHQVSGIGAFAVEEAGLSYSRDASPVFQRMSELRLIHHDHNPVLLDEHCNARVAEVESGIVLSAKRSQGPIPVMKASVWAVWAAATGRYDVEESQIY